MKYLSKFKLLYRSKHNTTQPAFNKIYQALKKPESEYTLGIFIDLTKAFGTCDIDIYYSKS